MIPYYSDEFQQPISFYFSFIKDKNIFRYAEHNFYYRGYGYTNETIAKEAITIIKLSEDLLKVPIKASYSVLINLRERQVFYSKKRN